MSYNDILEAMKNDPALAQQLHDAPSEAARAALLGAKGIAVPAPGSPLPGKDEIKSMSEVAGGSTYFNLTVCATWTP
jgi:hypothetical protein